MKKVVRYVVMCLLLFSAAAVSAEPDESWLHGKWELTYDPDGADKDWLEFLPDGDVFSSGPLGRLAGFYIVDGDAVKAVFTFRDKDFIMNFMADKQIGQLKIITSHTGRESIYSKIEDGKK